tara:strand:+ start:65 stop:991 length:927 start_codon:yes stop_codon:yes gene_type:complete
MKIVFMGTPHLCIPVLKRIAEDGHEILAVYTQPDRMAGRGRRKAISSLKEYSLSKNYQVLQPENFRDNSSEINTLKKFDADIAVVAAYGILLPPDVLNAFRHGCINLHPSLLPKYRGASPVSSAILAGDEYTGVTIIQLDSGLDSGPILSQEKIKLQGDEFCDKLTMELFMLGSKLVSKTISEFATGNIKIVQQDHDKATFTGKLSRKDGLIDWTKGSDGIWKEVRAYNPWPGSHTNFNGKNLKIIEAEISTKYKLPSGYVSIHGDEVYIGTSDGSLNVKKLQAEGGKIVVASDFARGHTDFENSVLG